jgi:endonuclease/exonuclease/phosphatase family metal-dependent hydrolase
MAKEGGRGAGPAKSLRPLLLSTLRQERKFHLARSPEDGDGHAVIASYNVHKCVGLDRKFDPQRTMTVIGEIGADVIALQEVDQRFGDRRGLLDLDRLERQLGLVSVPLDGARKSHGWHGNLVLVRNGAVSATQQIELPGIEPRGAICVDLTLSSGPVRIVAAHLGLRRRCRARQIEAILTAAGTACDRPVLVIGDLNEWRLGERSSLGALEPGFGPLQASVASFPSRFPLWSLDRILAKPDTLVSRIEIHDSHLARIASDHLPIKASVMLAQAARAGQGEDDVPAAA